MATQTLAINTLALNSERCIGCGVCVEVCPHGVLALRERKVRLARYEACMECGACQMNCPTGAIAVDSGVGCAAAFIQGILTGTEPNCGGDDDCCGDKRGCC